MSTTQSGPSLASENDPAAPVRVAATHPEPPVSHSPRRSARSRNALWPATKFLLPNIVGFLAFTLFPVVFAFWMAFTNWTLKPAVGFRYVWLQNFTDLLGVRALNHSQPALLTGYLLCCLAVLAGLVGALWANMARAKGLRLGGLLLVVLAVGFFWGSIHGGGQGPALAGIGAAICGIAAMRGDDADWNIGLGTVPGLLLLGGCIGITILNGAMWRVYVPQDAFFWQYLYNTLYLMIGIPISIAGSLGLALLLNAGLPLGPARIRIVGTLFSIIAGAATLIVLWHLGNPNMGLLGAILWGCLALGFAFNIVAYRTLFYLPTFTAGVALMILWKALYNPQTGPINVGLTAFFHAFGLHVSGPEWLSDVNWAKPALIIMGVWTGIGGTNMLLYLAGLSNVPQELMDAAAVDGANSWQRFKNVTWPQLAPTTFFISVMSIIGGLQGGFDQAQVMTSGGPAGSTTTLAYYIYERAFQDLDLGYAAAISWVLFAMVFVMTALNWKFGKGLEVER
ncbi:MAG TPA: sugar ABC transporter permease [Capsulimonadaceae bacterium]|nr:sugar ABC transporter permease [Capsulimonadaceae bacterium]